MNSNDLRNPGDHARLAELAGWKLPVALLPKRKQRPSLPKIVHLQPRHCEQLPRILGGQGAAGAVHQELAVPDDGAGSKKPSTSSSAATWQ